MVVNLWQRLDDLKAICGEIQSIVDEDEILKQYRLGGTPAVQLLPLDSQEPTGITIAFPTGGVMLARRRWYKKIEDQLATSTMEFPMPDGSQVAIRASQFTVLEVRLSDDIKKRVAQLISNSIKKELHLTEEFHIEIKFL